ncbi:hypothetical protein C8R43DRAFT_942287 [Mycena crocata]|nr:hypothetical protein C8R43DRAFT_942287 [Mycena crocata]
MAALRGVEVAKGLENVVRDGGDNGATERGEFMTMMLRRKWGRDPPRSERAAAMYALRKRSGLNVLFDVVCFTWLFLFKSASNHVPYCPFIMATAKLVDLVDNEDEIPDLLARKDDSDDDAEDRLSLPVAKSAATTTYYVSEEAYNTYKQLFLPKGLAEGDIRPMAPRNRTIRAVAGLLQRHNLIRRRNLHSSGSGARALILSARQIRDVEERIERKVMGDLQQGERYMHDGSAYISLADVLAPLVISYDISCRIKLFAVAVAEAETTETWGSRINWRRCTPSCDRIRLDNPIS